MAAPEYDHEINITWPDSIWPITVDALKNIPAQLLPNTDVLAKIQYPWELLVLLREELTKKVIDRRISDQAKISNHVEIIGPVWIESGVVIHPFSVIIGPAYIGKDSIIGTFTQIRASLVGDACLVGERTTIVRSVIGCDSKFHDNYVGDSILAKKVDMGGKVATANVRMDKRTIKSTVLGARIDTGLYKLGAIIGQNTVFGGNCLIMPGVKIGEGCIIGPKSMLQEDLVDHMTCKVQQELQLIKPL